METARAKQKQIESAQDYGEPKPLEELHKTVRATAKALRKVKPLADNSLQAIGPGHCGVTVRQDCAERAVHILDRLAHALDEQGLSLQPAGHLMKVANDTDELEFSLIEHIRREKHIPTEQELQKEKQIQEKRKLRNRNIPDWDALFSPQRAWPEFDYIRTGNLGIQIIDQYVGGARRSWNDGKTQRLETMIGEIAIGIVAYLTAIRLKREERERWHKEYEENQRKRALNHKRQEREEKRRAFINSLADKREQIERLKAFLAGVAWVPDGDEFDRMAAWTAERIRHLEQEIERSNIGEALRQNNLFPETDDLV